MTRRILINSNQKQPVNSAKDLNGKQSSFTHLFFNSSSPLNLFEMDLKCFLEKLLGNYQGNWLLAQM